MLSKLLYSNGNARSAKAIKNILTSFIVKGMSIVINLTLIPITINYLSPTKYGVWLTISSILGWISFFDIGLGHGLRNKLAESLAKNEIHKAKSYVSTAYISIALLCSGIFLIFLIANQFINWNTLLNIPIEIDENMKSIALILFSMFSIQFILSLVSSILLANQQPSRVSMFNMISNLLVLGAIFLLVKFTKESLYHIAFVFSVIPVIVFLTVNIFYFKTKFKSFSPSLKHFDYSALKDVLHLGLKFFIIQISMLIFFQTSNLLISRYFSPAFVTPYNIAFRYFGMITMIFNIIIAPYWSAYTEAYVKKDFVWIRKSIKQLTRLWMLLVLGAIIMLLFSPFLYKLWVGEKVVVDFKISLFMMIYTVMITFGNIYIMVLNGIGRIRPQMIFNIVGMVVFIPLSYFLAVMLNLGIVGIIMSTIICSIYGTLVAPFQVKKLLSESEKELMGESQQQR